MDFREQDEGAIKAGKSALDMAHGETPPLDLCTSYRIKPWEIERNRTPSFTGSNISAMYPSASEVIYHIIPSSSCHARTQTQILSISARQLNVIRKSKHTDNTAQHDPDIPHEQYDRFRIARSSIWFFVGLRVITSRRRLSLTASPDVRSLDQNV